MPAAANWPRVPIHETYVGLFDGPHATPKPSEEGPVFLGIGNISEDGHLDLTNVRHIAEEDFAKWTKRIVPKAGDIVFTYEATLNRYAIIPHGFRGCLGRRLALIRPNCKVVDTRFLHFYFFGADWRATIARNTLSGATVERVPLTRFPEFPVNLPSLAEQQRIASILSAYDDLIENNTRRIAILDEMARRIYEEWFVRFRFPGREGVRMVESALGLVPENWEAKRFEELLESWRGGDWGSDEQTAADTAPVFVIRGTDFDDLAHGAVNRLPARFIEPKSLEKRRLQPFDLVVENSINAKSRTAGKTLLITPGLLRRLGGDAIAASFCKVFRFHEPRVASLAHLKMRQLFEAGDMSFFQNIAANGIANFQAQRFVATQFIMLPREDARRSDLLGLFGCLTKSTFADANQNLRTTRDLLLPKLISGELDVSSLPEPESVTA